MIASPPQQKFGQDKFDTLPRYGRECDVRFACHVDHPRRFMAEALRRNRAPAEIMRVYAEQDRRLYALFAAAGRNDPCPCGSGKKFKHCHGQ